MSRTSETPDFPDLRCTCGKCLAKDGQIKCTRCDVVTDVRPRMLDEARHTAFYLCALATTAQMTRELLNAKPVTITLKKTGQALGYVQHQPINDRPLYTLQELKARLVMLMSGPAAEHVLGHITTGPSNMIAQARELARRMVRDCMVDCHGRHPDEVANELVFAAFEEAKQIVAANRETVESLAGALLYKGELTGDDVARLTAGVKNSGDGFSQV